MKFYRFALIFILLLFQFFKSLGQVSFDDIADKENDCITFVRKFYLNNSRIGHADSCFTENIMSDVLLNQPFLASIFYNNSVPQTGYNIICRSLDRLWQIEKFKEGYLLEIKLFIALQGVIDYFEETRLEESNAK